MNTKNAQKVGTFVNKNKAWTKAETNFLRANYGKMTAREIGIRLERPLQAIYGKAKAEKLKRAIPYKSIKKRVPNVLNVEQKESFNMTDNSVTKYNKNFKNSKLIILSLVMSIMAFITSAVSFALHFIH